MQRESSTRASLSVVQTRFFYERLPPPRSHLYSLVRIEQGPVSVPYQRLPIERFAEGSVATFNHLLCATCNRDSVLIIFMTDGKQYKCALPQNGVAPVLQVLDVSDDGDVLEEQERPRTTAVFDDVRKLQQSDLACTVFSLFFDYIRTNSNNLFLVDITAVPCAAHFVPRQFDSATLREWIRAWKCEKVTLARASARVVVRGPEGQFTVSSLLQPEVGRKVLRAAGDCPSSASPCSPPADPP